MADLDEIRSLNFVNHLHIEFEGNFLRKAICLGDIDNDGLNEMIIGNDKGQAAIFKDESTIPLYSLTVKGIISAIAVGDVVNIGRNILLIITVCGHLYLFDFEGLKSGAENLSPFHTQRIPANIKEVLIGDASGDGFCEVVFSMTDRVVRTYRWFDTTEPEEDWKCGKLVGLNKWEFAEQIGSICFISLSDGKQMLFVSQPGGKFIMPNVNTDSEKCGDSNEEISSELLTKIPLDLEALSSMKLQNVELCSSNRLSTDSETSGPTYAFATLDGNFVLVKGDKIQWKLQLDHQLFSVHCLDINNDGIDEVIACAWDGATFIVDNEKKVIRFIFKEAVSSFTAGLFGFKGKNVPCFVYTTFNNSIYLYHNVGLPSMSVTSLLDTLRESQEFKDIVNSLNIDLSDANSMRKLTNFVLYGGNKFEQ